MSRAQWYSKRRIDPPLTNWLEVPVVFDIAMACRLLGYTPEAVRRRLAEGSIPGRKVESGWRIRKDELMAYLGYLPWEIERFGFGLSTTRRSWENEHKEEAG